MSTLVAVPVPACRCPSCSAAIELLDRGEAEVARIRIEIDELVEIMRAKNDALRAGLDQATAPGFARIKNARPR